MKTAILHIGTEKTGTTSIQQFLFLNRKRLANKGWLFPASAGYLSNHRLVVYGKRAPEPDLAWGELDVSDPVDLAEWRERFVVELCEEVLSFQRRHRRSTVLFSSEHLQSRVTGEAEIRRVARLLRPMFDEVRVVVWLRRQDRFATSAHSTSIRGGNPDTFSFDAVNAAGPYYDHRQLLDNWARVFGQEAMTVRVFERSRLVDGDVVADFRELVGLSDERARRLPGALGRSLGRGLDRGLGREPDRGVRNLRMPEAENEALSWTAQAILRAFNRRSGDDPSLVGLDRDALRQHLLVELQRLEDDHGAIRPSRAAARAFQARFDACNEEVAARWLGGKGFDDRFDDYPENPAPAPDVPDAEARLDALIDAWRGAATARAA